MYSFKSDYSEGAHPAILQALAAENLRQNPGYGMDPHCAAAAARIRELACCPQADVHFLVGGTPCNLISLTAFLRPHQAAIAAQTGHIAVHESGSIEAAGHKVCTIDAPQGKLTGALVRRVAAEAPEQTTLDAMIAASEFEDERDRAKVLKADDPERCACRIREERKCEAARAEVRTLVAGVGLDVEWMGGPAPWPYGCESKKTRGLAYAMKVGGEGDVETLSKRFSGERLVAWASGLGWDVWRRLPEDADERERQKAALEGLREASASACKEFAASVARWLSGRGSLPRDLASLVRADRTGYSPARVLGVEVDSGDSALAAILDSEPSVHEAVSYLDQNMPWGIRNYDGSFDEERARWVDDVWEAIACEGWADNEARAMGEELDACWRSLETEKSS